MKTGIRNINPAAAGDSPSPISSRASFAGVTGLLTYYETIRVVNFFFMTVCVAAGLVGYHKHMIDEQDKRIISLIQGDLPLDPSPFALLATKIGMDEAEFIDRVKSLKERGIIRRFGATLRHQEAGFNSNAMIAWLVPDNRINQIGKSFAQFREVSHCYHRAPQRDWPYNLYTMIHGSNREECHKIADRLSESVSLKDFELLFSEKEFKKTSMKYFSEKSHGKTI